MVAADLWVMVGAVRLGVGFDLRLEGLGGGRVEVDMMNVFIGSRCKLLVGAGRAGYIY